MKWSKVTQKLTRIKYIKWRKATHFTIWNCPCGDKVHPVGIGNNPAKECRLGGYLKRQLGPHYEDFLKA